jgi:hypothetical protein
MGQIPGSSGDTKLLPRRAAGGGDVRQFALFRWDDSILIRVTIPRDRSRYVMFVRESEFLECLKRVWDDRSGGPWKNELVEVPAGYKRRVIQDVLDETDG